MKVILVLAMVVSVAVCATMERSATACTTQWEANVCGLDGNPYPNTCWADSQSGGHQACSVSRKRSQGCPCPRKWEPVCDATGTQYPNSCVAGCHGVSADELEDC